MLATAGLRLGGAGQPRQGGIMIPRMMPGPRQSAPLPLPPPRRQCPFHSHWQPRQLRVSLSASGTPRPGPALQSMLARPRG